MNTEFNATKTAKISYFFSSKNAYLSHFLWNLKFKYFSKINYFIFGLVTFLAFLFAFLAASAINSTTSKDVDPLVDSLKMISLSAIFIFIIFLSILFLIISTSSHTSEEKNSRAMEIILSSVGVKYHWFVKLATNFVWFISIFVWIIFIGCLASFFASIAILHTFNFSGSMILGWVLGLSSNFKWMLEHHHAMSFGYIWNHVNMMYSYDFFISMIFLVIAVNGLIYSIITLALSSFIVNSGESLMIVLVILLFPIILSIILGLIAGVNSQFVSIFLCYFPLSSIYQIPTLLFSQKGANYEAVIWTSFLVNCGYVAIFYYIFSKLYIQGVLNYSKGTKLFRRIFSKKPFFKLKNKAKK